MKRVGIICNLMTSYGGVQTCVISLIKGLNQQGITPVLLSTNTPKKSLWEEQDLRCETKRINYSMSIEKFQKYKFLQVIWEFVFYFKTSWLNEKYDFIYIFQPNIMIDNNQKHLFYLSMSPRANNYSKNPFLSRFKTTFYNIFLKRFHPIFEFQNYDCVINSKYTAQMFYDYFNKHLKVVYPSNSIEPYLQKDVEKVKKSVVFLSRIAEDKKPELLLRLAELHDDFNFIIMGSVNENNFYYKQLLDNIEKLRLRNVKLLVNQPYIIVTKQLKQAEYYTFFAENEHFGITTVEAMLNDCIPFVHNSGGQKEIVPFDELRFEYDNLESSFERLISMNAIEKKMIRKKLKSNVENFKENVFINQMIGYLPII